MKIYNENPLKEIKNIVQLKAKFQKVMLLFDDNVSNLEIHAIYEEIKEMCIFNKVEINKINKDELFNGYRLIIFYCSAENYLKCEFNKEEFICVFVPVGSSILPFYLNLNNNVESKNNYLLMNKAKIDLNLLASIKFNMFYNYFKNLISGQNSIADFSLNQEITQFNALNYLENISENTFFVDIDIIKFHNIDYCDLILIDLILVDAFLLLIESVKEQNLMLVDVYKSMKDDCEMIEKFYRLSSNEIFIKLILLNYNCLHKYCENTKQKLIDLIGFCSVEQGKIENLMQKIKNYAKNDNDLIAFLYLYNIFEV